MSANWEQFDDLFHKAAHRFGPSAGPIPYADLLRAAHLGFDDDFARQVLGHHASLAFLNRLWDAERVDGLPVGPARVPGRIWELAEGPDAVGRLHTRLLEATGMRLPAHVDDDLSVHLTLWGLHPAMRGSEAQPPGIVCGTGPVRLTVSLVAGGLEVEVVADTPGRYDITLVWGDHHSLKLTTEALAVGEVGWYGVATELATPPDTAIIAIAETR